MIEENFWTKEKHKSIIKENSSFQEKSIQSILYQKLIVNLPQFRGKETYGVRGLKKTKQKRNIQNASSKGCLDDV